MIFLKEIKKKQRLLRSSELVFKTSSTSSTHLSAIYFPNLPDTRNYAVQHCLANLFFSPLLGKAC
jgi:hypothetical protein